MARYVYKLKRQDLCSVFASRLSNERAKKGLTQKEVVEGIAALISDSADEKLSPLTYAAYEQGQRLPSSTTLYMIALFFNASIDYLLGLTDEKIPVKTDTGEGDCPIFDPGVIIAPRDYSKHHNRPVYIVGPSNAFEDKWGILDYENNQILCSDATYELSPIFKLYALPPLESLYPNRMLKNPLTYSQLMDVNNRDGVFWVNMLTSDKFVQGKYNGWYVHNEDASALINRENSLVLSYTGIRKAYNVYKL